jgi:hypothetical protein
VKRNKTFENGEEDLRRNREKLMGLKTSYVEKADCGTCCY